MFKKILTVGLTSLIPVPILIPPGNIAFEINASGLSTVTAQGSSGIVIEPPTIDQFFVFAAGYYRLTYGI